MFCISFNFRGSICIEYLLGRYRNCLEFNLTGFLFQLINGITFVDAPGIHDTDESFLSLQPHIQDSDAFIFVISNAEHDGVAKDRVSGLH